MQALCDSMPISHFLRTHFRLYWHGFHGAGHWARVAWNGKCLARAVPEVNARIVQAFALCHDIGRCDEGEDKGHGLRSAQLLRQTQAQLWLGLQEGEFEELLGAIAQHSERHAQGSVTQQVCWDADRLDLWRVGTMPDPDRLYTEAARCLHFDRLFGGDYC